MKIKEGFVIRKVMGNNVVIATGAQSKNFHGMVKLNDTAAEIWSYLAEGMNEDDICNAMLAKYDVDGSTLRNDVKATLETLITQGFVEL